MYSEEEGGGNYFQLFGLYSFDGSTLSDRHETYDINPAELEANFKNLQKVVHPDLFSTKSPVILCLSGIHCQEEKRVSEKVSSTLNIAHNKLKDPVTRAAYLVVECERCDPQAKLRTGKDVLGEDKNYKVPVELLMEVMELRSVMWRSVMQRASERREEFEGGKGEGRRAEGSDCVFQKT